MSRTFILVKPERRSYMTWRGPRWALRVLLRLTGWEARPLVTFDSAPSSKTDEGPA